MQNFGGMKKWDKVKKKMDTEIWLQKEGLFLQNRDGWQVCQGCRVLCMYGVRRPQ